MSRRNEPLAFAAIVAIALVLLVGKAIGTTGSASSADPVDEAGGAAPTLASLAASSDAIHGERTLQGELRTLSLDDVQGGALLVATDTPGRYLAAATVSTDAHITITGPIARTALTQRFERGGRRGGQHGGEGPADAIYAFALPPDAAIDRLRLRVGARVIEGVIRERGAARRTFERARASGQRAALLEQHRPNLFTTEVANLPSGETVSVEIEYQQLALWREETFSLRVPTAITPRFAPTPPRSLSEAVALGGSGGAWGVPMQTPAGADARDRTGEDAGADEPGPVELPGAGAPARLSLSITLDAGLPLASVRSPSHTFIEEGRGAQRTLRIDDAQGANRDFVLHWQVEPSAAPRAAFFTEQNPQGHYGLLMVMPPSAAFEPVDAPRQITFVLDTSGSMAGPSIRQAQLALTRALQALKPTDAFDVVRFASGASALFGAQRPASPSNVARAIDHVAALGADGGTNIAAGLDVAFRGMPERADRIQQIVFVTDGAVSNEAALFSSISASIGTRRLFTVAIGSAPNQHFMEEAAHAGRGSFVNIADVAEVGERMRTLLERIERPALTDLALELPGVATITPDPLPDLYRGEPVLAHLAFDGDVGDASGNTGSEGTLSGRIGQRPWETQLTLRDRPTSGIGLQWARMRIRHWLRQGTLGLDRATVRERVLGIALAHGVVSPFTSFVAVDRTPLPDARPAGDGDEPRRVALARGSTAGPLLRAIGAALLMLAIALLLVTRAAAPRGAPA